MDNLINGVIAEKIRLNDACSRTLSHAVLANIMDSLTQSRDSLSDIAGLTQDAVNQIDLQLEELTKPLLELGYSYGGNHLGFISQEHERTHRAMQCSVEVRNAVMGKISRLSSPRYPGLEIGPGDAVWTDCLVACDPLYLVDIHQDFIDSTLAHFPESYQRRVRPYLISKFARITDYDLSALPQNQFGFIFSWNVFDYLPHAVVLPYLEQCHKVLRPGGSMLFSYNNCEDPLCARWAETAFKSWMPYTLLSKTCTDLGFEISESHSFANGVHFVIIKKPGQLKTVKLHQSLGEICQL